MRDQWDILTVETIRRRRKASDAGGCGGGWEGEIYERKRLEEDEILIRMGSTGEGTSEGSRRKAMTQLLSD